MKCPVCKTQDLKATQLEPDLAGAACPACSGVWISRPDYEAWRERHPIDVPETTPAAEPPVQDNPVAKLCPECHHLLVKYHIGHGTGFQIEHCGSCGGFWLDAGEWAALKQHGLHDNLNLIILPQWQKDVRQRTVQEKLEEAWRQQLGEGDYTRVMAFRDWLNAHPQKSMILALLSRPQP